MRHYLSLALLSILYMGLAKAEDEGAMVICDPKAQTLTIRYVHKDSESKLPGHVDFWDLLEIEKCSESDRFTGDPCRAVGQREAILACELGKDRFMMRFYPEPFNDDLQGRCGAIVSGSVLIEKNNHPFLKATSFDPSRDCLEDGVNIISTIEVRPDLKEPLITWGERDDFYNY